MPLGGNVCERRSVSNHQRSVNETVLKSSPPRFVPLVKLPKISVWAILEIEPVRLRRRKALVIQKPHNTWAVGKVQALHDVDLVRDVRIPLAPLTLTHVFFDDHSLSDL